MIMSFLDTIIVDYARKDQDASLVNIPLNSLVTDEIYIYWSSNDIVQNLNLTEITINNIPNNNDSSPILSINNFTNNNNHPDWNENLLKNKNIKWTTDAFLTTRPNTSVDEGYFIYDEDDNLHKYFYLKVKTNK